MQKFKAAAVAAAAVVVLAFVLTAIGPQRVMAALGYTPVRDVDGPSRRPFQVTIGGTTSENSFSVSTRRLIIDHISGFLTFISGSPTEVAIRTTVDGTTALHFLHPNFAGTDGTADYYDVSETGGIYADPNTTVTAIVVLNGADTFDRFTISGHLVDVP